MGDSASRVGSSMSRSMKPWSTAIRTSAMSLVTVDGFGASLAAKPWAHDGQQALRLRMDPRDDASSTHA